MKNTSQKETVMITKVLTVTHFSLFGFDGNSDLWEDFLGQIDNNGRPDCEIRSFRGTLSHVGFPPACVREVNVDVISDFILGHEMTLKYETVQGVLRSYKGTINFGLDQKVLALHIWNVGDQGCFFKNAVKLYTTIPSTKEFLSEKKPLF